MTPVECHEYLSPTYSPCQAYALFPQSFKDVIELLLPELRARHLLWDDYAVPGGTYRENFYGKEGARYPLDEHVAASYHWKAEPDDGLEEGTQQN